MSKKSISYEGQTIGNFTILKELGKGKVIARCNPCGVEKEFRKYSITKKVIKSCGCLNLRDFIDYTGQTIGNFTIIKELGGGKVIARCKLCGKEKELKKYGIIYQSRTSCGCLTNFEGETIGNFTILKELGNRRVIAKCNLCGKEKEYDKYSIVHKIFKSCGCLKYKN